MATTLSDDQWKQRLTPQQYQVLRRGNTEAPGTGALLNNKADGSYHCAACGQLLFKSDTKFDSGTGWPSFNNPATTEAVQLKEDASHGMHRVEVTCRNCGSHLGHVFNDAPEQPTGMRFCINSCALDFNKK